MEVLEDRDPKKQDYSHILEDNWRIAAQNILDLLNAKMVLQKKTMERNFKFIDKPFYSDGKIYVNVQGKLENYSLEEFTKGKQRYEKAKKRYEQESKSYEKFTDIINDLEQLLTQIGYKSSKKETTSQVYKNVG